MQDPPVLGEADLALVHALQIAPRAPWALVGRALGVNPVTAARRWARLVDDGLAWVTAYPGPLWAGQRCVAFVEVDCEPSRRLEVVGALVRDPRVVSLEHVSAGCDLFLTAMVPSL